MCSETSPRISFSNDLTQEDEIPVDRRDTTLLESNSDFEFSICSSIDYEYSLADDIFAHGMLLPVNASKFSSITNQKPPLPNNSKKEITVLEDKTQSSNKSFWGFKRSSSLNCDLKKSLCSLPLLSRSNSTGSVPTKQKPSPCKDIISKNNSQKQQHQSKKSYVYALPHKPPLKKNYNGVKFSPVLHVPPPYITKGAANFFGLGSFFRNGKVVESRK